MLSRMSGKHKSQKKISKYLENNPIQSHCIAGLFHRSHLHKGKFFFMVDVNINNSISCKNNKNQVIIYRAKYLLIYTSSENINIPGPAVFPPIACITWLKNVATDCTYPEDGVSLSS